MRFRVSQSRFFRWARPAAVETEGELLREAVFDRLLYGAVYPRPARERRTAGGIVPETEQVSVRETDSPAVRDSDWELVSVA